MLSAAVVAKIVGDCGTSAIASRRSAGSSVAHVDAVDRDRARLRIVEAQQQREHRALARAGRADQGDGFARSHAQAEVLERRQVRAHRVVEGHVVEARPRRAPAAAARRGCAGAAMPGGSLQQFGDAAHAAGGALQFVPDFGQRADRAAADQRVQHELARACRRSCVPATTSCAPDHSTSVIAPKISTMATAVTIACERMRLRAVSTAIASALAEAAALVGLARMRLHGAHGAEGFGGERVGVGDAVLAGARRPSAGGARRSRSAAPPAECRPAR